MKVIFMGSGELACPPVERLLASDKDELVAVVTQPDRPKGRNRRVGACPAKEMAEARGVPVFTPEKIGASGSISHLADLEPDLIAVAAYGQYISPAILKLPPKGIINIHPSLLPRYRGAAPIQMAIADGHKETGVTILHVSEEMDAGDIILQEKATILDDDTTATLKPRLAELGADLLMRAIDLIREGKDERVPQNDAEANYVHKLTKEDGRIDWRQPAEAIRNRIRGFNPWPSCYCEHPAGSGHYLKVLCARVEKGAGEPGVLLDVKGDGPLVATGDGALRLIEVQPEGKRAMTGQAFLCGHQLKAGGRLG